jgi:FdrA protein
LATDSARNDLLHTPVVAVNVGLELFYHALRDQGVVAAQVEWKPPAGGDEKLAGLLDRLSGRGHS